MGHQDSGVFWTVAAHIAPYFWHRPHSVAMPRCSAVQPHCQRFCQTVLQWRHESCGNMSACCRAGKKLLSSECLAAVLARVTRVAKGRTRCLSESSVHSFAEVPACALPSDEAQRQAEDADAGFSASLLGLVTAWEYLLHSTWGRPILVPCTLRPTLGWQQRHCGLLQPKKREPKRDEAAFYSSGRCCNCSLLH